MKEQITMAVYDLSSNRHRRKAQEACLDAGLKRFQKSAYVGKISAARRRALFEKIKALIRSSKDCGRVLVTPLCETDFQQLLQYEEGEEDEDDDPGLC